MSNFIAVADTSLERQAEAQAVGVSQDSSYATVRGEAEQDTAQDDVQATGEEALPTPATVSEGQSCSVRGTFTVGEPQ